MSERVQQDRRVLRFCLAGNGYAVAVESVAGVGEPAAIRPVPLAPPAVLGVTEWHGRPVTVVDLPRLLGVDAGGEPCLLALAPPFEHTALLVRRPVSLGTTSPEPEDDATPGRDERSRLIDLPAIVARAAGRDR